MLVLTRKRDESIMIGDHIKIVVVDVRGDQVKLGIEAPRTIPVHREEVYREIQEENRRAAAARAPISVEELERMIKEPPAADLSQTPAGSPGHVSRERATDVPASPASGWPQPGQPGRRDPAGDAPGGGPA